MTFKIHIYDEGSLTDLSSSNNTMLMKRFNIIQIAKVIKKNKKTNQVLTLANITKSLKRKNLILFKKANIFGILIGNPKVKYARILSNRVRDMLKAAKKKFYSFALSNEIIYP